MKREMKRSLCVLLVMLLALGSTTALADEKNETVYVLADTAGQPVRVIVSECVTDDAGAKTTTQSEGDRDLPVSVSIRYELDGEPIEPADLAGRSGHLVIRIDYESGLTGTANIKGKRTDMPVPFLAATVLPLDKDVCSNVEVTDGKVIDAGRASAVVCFGLPGLGEALNVNGYDDIDLDIDIPTGAVISADVTNYTNDGSYTIVTGVPGGVSGGKLPSALELEGASMMLKMAMNQLTSGADELAVGTDTLLSGANELAAGAGSLSAGAEALNEGAASLSQGLSELNANSAALTDGADQIIAAILETVNETLSASSDMFQSAGIDLNVLTLDNYADEIDRIEAALLAAVEARVYDEADAALAEKVTGAVREQVAEKVTEAVREQAAEKVTAAAREQVTAQVEAAVADAVREKVTEAVREQVTEKVTETVREQVEAQLREAGIEEGKLAAGVSAQMETEQVKAAIEQNVAAQMDTEDVK
ncbi:MAG: hypothetical protein J5602_09515, partial [Clostridia bacterium]|nr:hypothetical protein [Clostridia bacterium]